MAELVITLDHPKAHDPAITGGKGAALARLVAADLPVPDGFVVTAPAFAHGAGDLLPEVQRIVAAADHTDFAALQRACAEAVERVTSHRLPDELVDAVRGAYERLGQPSVAVRSSATAEDLPNASFAGQYDTFLNVTSHGAVLERILHVWASLYSPHAVAYRRRQGIADEALRMAVIVQRLLPAEAAGVLFTRDPVSGDDDRFVVNAAFGLGEGVVDGTVPSDHFSLHPETGEVVSQDVAHKEHMMGLAHDGGLERIEVEAARRPEPALSERHLADLTNLARSVKELFGGHQDLEFAVYEGAVHLLQARPVTGVTEEPDFPVVWENAEDANHLWILGQIGQQALLPSHRLEEDIMRAYADAARGCFEETGAPLARLHIFRFVNGYRYVRSPDADEQQVAERLQAHRARVEQVMERGVSWWETELQPQVERVLDELDRSSPHDETLPALADHLEQAIQGFGHVFGDLHWRLAASREDPMGWAALYSEATGRPELDAGTIVQATENRTTRMARWLRNLARLVQSDDELRAVFSYRAYERLDDPAMRSRPAVRTFHARFRNLLRHYGRRTGLGFGSAATFATPTWNMDPRRPLEMIASYAKQDIGELERIESDARQERDREVRRIRRSLAGEPQRLATFERALAYGREYVRLMENHNHLMEQSVGGAVREAADRAGRRLVSAGLAGEPDDVLHLSLAELKAIAAGGSPANVRAVIAERNQEFQRRSQLHPPRTIGEGGPPPMPPHLARTSGMKAGEDAGWDDAIIRGTSASRGRATGRARIAAAVAQPPAVEKGDILVASNAGPSWTPILPLIAGLVLDEGAVFQHAVLVAREYRVPTVIMTHSATTQIKDGQTITVDGDEGIVELSP